jgi:RHS repeat-associated protein
MAHAAPVTADSPQTPVGAGSADLTGDRVGEIVTGAGLGYAPQVKVFSGTGRPLTEFLATSASDRNGVSVGVVANREGQPRIATLVGSGRSKQVRLFDPHSSGTPAPLASYRAVGTGSLGTPSDRSEVKRFDASNPTPRVLRQVYRHRAVGVMAAGYSAFPIRYGDGVVHFQERDLAADGFGTSWGVTRSWTNEGAYSHGQNVGRGWIIAETPSLIREVDPFSGAVVLTVVTGGTGQQVFDQQPDGSYVGRGGILDTLVYVSASGQYQLTAPDGTELWFWDFDLARPAQQRGQFARLEDPNGNVTEVTSLLADGRVGEVQRSAPAGGSTVTESYLFTYVAGGPNAGLIESITQRCRVGSGPWNTVRKAEYVYYDGVEPHGSAGDLKKVIVKDAADAVLETSYYRYYVAGENNGYEGGLKYVFRPQSYARLAANVANPETATDAEIAPYADHYFEYDDQFRVTKEITNYVDGVVGDDNDITTEYAYNAVGRTSLTSRRADGSGQTTEWVYGVSTATGSGLNSNDIVGQTRWPDPATGQASSSEQETVTVNALGQTLTATDRNGNVHTLSYDVLGRLIADAVTTLGANVDGSVRRIDYGYDALGNLALITSYDAASGGNIVNQVKRQFNGLGQLTSEWQEHTGAVTGSSLRVQYAYSEMADGANHSRLTSIIYPNGKVLNYNYAAGLDDAISRLSSLSDSTGILESYDYLGEAVVVARRHPQPGVDLSYIKRSGEANGDAGDQYTGLDRFGRIVDQRWLHSSDGSAVDRLQYTYDRNGNRLSRTNLIDAAFSESYSYDNLNQLTSFTRGTHTRSWDYDAQGNWQSVTTNGNTQTRSHNAQNEITGISGAITPTYDANGNLTRDETGRQFVYDAWNRLVEVKDDSGNTLKSYAYDGQHRRIQETAGGTTTNLYYSDAWQVLEERVTSGGTSVPRVQYVWSPVYVDALILRDRDTNGDGVLDERLYVVQDANYNITALFDNSGSVVERYVYDPFGQVTVLDAGWSTLAGSAFGWVYLHQGDRFDATNGLYHFRHRDYSPTLGRWTRLDPIRYAAGDINLYRGLVNNPANYLDSIGLDVGEPGLLESLIPVWGSGREAIHSFENGQYLRGTFHTVLAVTDVFLLKSIFTAGGKLFVKGGAKLASKEAIEEATVRTAIEATENLTWKKLDQGTRIVFVEEAGVWVKEVNPNVSRFGQWWGKKTLDEQAKALKKLDDLAPRFLYQDGKLIIEDVGPLAKGNMDLGRFAEYYLRGSWRLGTPFNDIRPWNMGKNGKIFDPVYHPIHEMLIPTAGEVGLTVFRVGDQLFYVYPEKEKQMLAPVKLPQRR